MFTNKYFLHYVMHYIAKTLKVHHVRYRLQTRCFFVHQSLKRDKEKNDEIKKWEITRNN